MDYASSTELGKRYLNSQGFDPRDRVGYQAHHIIPVNVVNEYVDNYDYEDKLIGFLDDWNCLMLPAEGDAICHNGDHPTYSDFVRQFLVGIQDIDAYIDRSHKLADMIRSIYNQLISDYRKAQLCVTLDQFCEETLIPLSDQILSQL